MLSPASLFHSHPDVSNTIVLRGVSSHSARHLGASNPLSETCQAWCGAHAVPTTDGKLETWGKHPTGTERYCPQCEHAARLHHVPLGDDALAPVHYLSPLDVVRAPVTWAQRMAALALSLVVPTDQS